MRTFSMMIVVAWLVSAFVGVDASAQSKAAYEQRAAARYVELFEWLDSGHKGAVTRAEAGGSIDFITAFDDIDINRDGTVTKAELERFLALRYSAAERGK
jgi:hypothetical protein